MSAPSADRARRRPRALLAALAAAGAIVLALVAWRALRRAADSTAVAPTIGAAALEPDVEAVVPLARDEASSLDPTGATSIGASAGGAGVRLPGPGRLVGRVLERASGVGVPDARVELLALPPAGRDFFHRALRLAKVDPAVLRRTLPIAVARSDASGAFRFEGVREGRYYVDALCTEHVAEAAELARVLESGSGGPIDVWVRAGGSVRGSFVRADGEGVAGATVILVAGPGLVLDSARSGSLRAIETRTDESGAFAFAGVAPGAGYDLSGLGPGTTVSHALDLSVVAGADTEARIEARAGGSIAGRVVSLARAGDASIADAEPVPLAGARIAAVPRGLRDLRFAEELLDATQATSDAAGAFVLRRVPPGEVDLVAVDAGHVAGVVGPVVVVEGVAGETVDIELEAGPVVRGRVVDPEGRPLAGVRVRWNTFDFRELGRNGLEIRFAPFLTQALDGFEYPVTEVDGSFTAGPFPGEPAYRIQFYAPGFQDVSERWTPGEGPERLEVVMHRGGSIEGIVMDLAEARPVTRFQIRTTDRVELAADEPGRFNPFAGGTLIEDAGGAFRIDSVRAGEVALAFDADGYLPALVEGIQVNEGQATRGLIVKLTRGGAVRGSVVDAVGAPVAGAQVLALPPGAGRERSRGRDPRRGAMLDYVDEIPPALLAYAAGLGLLAERSTRTDAAGEFELTGVEAGAAFLVALHPDHVPGRSAEVNVTAGEALEGVSIALSRGGGLHGKVEDRHGRPLAGSLVFAAAPARFGRSSASNFGGGLYQALADERGDYRIERMSPGSYFVVATRGDDALDPASLLASFDFDLVNVPAEEVVRFDIVDEAAGATRVYGRVTDAGAPVERGSLSALGFESDNLLGVDLKLARLREGGEYEFAGLAPGEYQLELQGAPARARMTVEIPDLPEYRLDLELPSGSIEGVVVAASTGEPVARCELTLRPLADEDGGTWIAALVRSQGRAARARSDAEGAFRFERLEAGEYELIARPRASEDGPNLGASEPLALEIASGEHLRRVEIELASALVLEGVVQGEGGEPVAGARVTALASGERAERPPRARTGDDGRFEIQGLGPGVYELLVSADGYAAARVEGVTLDADPREAIVVELERGVLVSLRVAAADGRPLAGARARLARTGAPAVEAADVDGAMRQLFGGEGGTDADGWMELGRYEPGDYEVSVWRGFSRASFPVVVPDSRTSAVELAVTMP